MDESVQINLYQPLTNRTALDFPVDLESKIKRDSAYQMVNKLLASHNTSQTDVLVTSIDEKTGKMPPAGHISLRRVSSLRFQFTNNVDSNSSFFFVWNPSQEHPLVLGDGGQHQLAEAVYPVLIPCLESNIYSFRNSVRQQKHQLVSHFKCHGRVTYIF